MAPESARKFIDLIFKASAKWANWNPPHEIKVGDYGQLDKRTGALIRQGNIYDDTWIYKDEDIAQLVKDHPPKQAAREDVFIAASRTVNRTDLVLGAEIGIPGLGEAMIKGQWTFGSKRGALLIMANPRSSYIPRDTLLEHLAKVEALKDKHLVTEVLLCPAYCLYLSSGNSEVVGLALLGSLPVPYAPGVTVGAEIEGKWWAQNATGLFRGGCDPDGNDQYMPLYMLKEIRMNKGLFSRRGDEIQCEGDDHWCDIQAPWNPLDDDGNEEEFEDTVFD